MPYSSGSVDTQSLADRRSHPRQSVLLSCVELDDNGGIVLNVSETGLAMQVVKTLPDNPYTNLRFQLSLSNSWIETRGRIAWLSGSKNKAGVEFVDLDLEGRTLLAKWISSAAEAELGADQTTHQPAGRMEDRDFGVIADPSPQRPTEHTAKQVEDHIERRIESSPAELLPAYPAAASANNSVASDAPEPETSAKDEPIDILSDYAVHALNAPETAGADQLFPERAINASTPLASEDAPSRRGGFTIYSPDAAARWGIAEGGLGEYSAKPHSRIGLFVGLAVIAVALTFVAISLSRPAPKGSAAASAVKKNVQNGLTPSESVGSGTATPGGESFAPGAGFAAEHASPSGPAPVAGAAASLGAGKALNAKKPSGASPADSAAHSPAALPSSAAAPAADSGFVLQVAAMSDQANALSFADTLRQRNFTVFVVKPPADPFYRVLVGPYSDARSAATGAAQLRQQGFSAIRKPNVPAP